MTIRSNLIELEHWLTKQSVSPDDLPPPIEQARLTELQSAFAQPFPEALLALFGWHGGLPDWLMFGGTWHLLGSSLILEIYWENREVFGNDIATDPWRAEWLPLLSNGAGDYLLLDLETLEMGYFFHEGGEHEAAFVDLAAYFIQLTDHIRSGRYRLSEEGIEFY